MPTMECGCLCGGPSALFSALCPHYRPHSTTALASWGSRPSARSIFSALAALCGQAAAPDLVDSVPTPYPAPQVTSGCHTAWNTDQRNPVGSRRPHEHRYMAQLHAIPEPGLFEDVIRKKDLVTAGNVMIIMLSETKNKSGMTSREEYCRVRSHTTAIYRLEI
jgi:hypothetical protein